MQHGTEGVEILGSQRAGLFLNLIPVFSVGISWWLLAEPVEMFHVVGVAVILSGIVLAAHQSG